MQSDPAVLSTGTSDLDGTINDMIDSLMYSVIRHEITMSPTPTGCGVLEFESTGSMTHLSFTPRY